MVNAALQMLTPAEVGTRLRASRSQVYALVRRGELRAVRIGTLVRITEGAYREYLSRIGVTDGELAEEADRPTKPEDASR